MNWTGFIARRYLFSKNNPNAINIISGIAVTGFAVGAMALITVLSVFNGFENLVQSLYNAFDPDLKVSAARAKTFDSEKLPLPQLRSIQGVNEIALVLEENIVLSYDEKQTIAMMKGVSENYTRINKLDSMMYEGELLLQKGEENYAVPGYGVASRLGVSPYNDFVRLALYVPRKGAEISLNPERALNQVFVYPTGIFNIEDELNNKYVLVPLRLARQLLEEENKVSSLEIALLPGADVEEVQSKVISLLGPDFEVKNRAQQQDALYRVFRYEKWITALILVFIMFLLAMTALSSLTMLVLEKRKDISIIKSMGADSKHLWRIFMKEGLLISGMGAGIGLGLGLLLCWLQIRYGLLEIQGGTFIISAYPVAIKWEDVVLVMIFTMLLGLITSTLPARKAARMAMSFHR
jgi:ABC-type lipoprotein release transport system permease subunit